MSLQLFLIGPSGSGKSTQAKLVADKYQLTHFSMGQLLRDEITIGSRLGQDAKVAIDAGLPVSDDIVLPILSQKLLQLSCQNFIIDGFPRLIDQGQYIDRFLANQGTSTTLLIHLLVDFIEIARRRQAAGKEFQSEDKDRSDNSPQAIANRQKILYEQNVGPILDYYREQSKLFEVDGSRPIEPIFADICQFIDQIK